VTFEISPAGVKKAHQPRKFLGKQMRVRPASSMHGTTGLSSAG